MKKIMIIITLAITMMTTAFNNSDSYAMEIDGVWPYSQGECVLFKYMDEKRVGNEIVYYYRKAWVPKEMATAWDKAITEEKYILNGGGNTFNYVNYLYEKYDLNNLLKKYGCD